MRYILAVMVLALSVVFIAPQPKAHATPVFAYTGLELALNSNMVTRNIYLDWSSNSCSNGAVYNWYANASVSGTNTMPYYSSYIASNVSSVRNWSPNCNRIWLKSGSYGGRPAGQVYSQCLRYGQAINWFGYPYNDNVVQFGLSYDGNC